MWQHWRCVPKSSAGDPDPVGSKTFSRIRIRLRIQKNNSGSSQLRIRNEFSVKKLIWKTDKIWQFSTKMLNLKYKFLFIKKNSLKSLYLVIICNLTHLPDGNIKVKFMLRILEKSHVRSWTKCNVGFRSGSGKNHSGSPTLPKSVIYLLFYTGRPEKLLQ